MHVSQVDALPAPPAGLLTGASLFLDFDGTLVDLAARPDAVAVDQRLHQLMTALRRKMAGRLAVVSGRAADEICELFGAPDFIVSGSHGVEFRYPDGTKVRAPRPDGLSAALDAMHAFAPDWPDVLVEDKPLGAALHFRGNPRAESACVALAQGLAAQHGLQLQTGKMMIEIRAGGGDKGDALRTLLATPEMRGTAPIFLGDDDTDEPGFVTAALMGGAGVLVGPARPSAARYRLSGVSAVLDWLEAAAQ